MGSERVATASGSSWAWDAFADAYARSVTIREGCFHLGPNGAGLDLTAPPICLAGHEEVLDLGCGAGANTRAAAALCRRAVGVDHSGEQILRARRATGDANVRYVHARIEDYVASCPAESADFVFSVFALEYVEDLNGVLGKMASILRPGGRMLYCDLHPVASAADIVGATPHGVAQSFDYFAEGPRPFDWPSPQGTERFVRHHRSFSAILNSAVSAGLQLIWSAEPRVAPDPAGCAYQDPSITRQHVVWRRVPYTLCLALRKP